MKRLTATIDDKHLPKLFAFLAELKVFEFTITDDTEASPRRRRAAKVSSGTQDVLNSRPCAIIMSHYGTGLSFSNSAAEGWVKAERWAGASPHLSRLTAAGYLAREPGKGKYRFIKPFPTEDLKRLTTKT